MGACLLPSAPFVQTSSPPKESTEHTAEVRKSDAQARAACSIFSTLRARNTMSAPISSGFPTVPTSRGENLPCRPVPPARPAPGRSARGFAPGRGSFWAPCPPPLWTIASKRAPVNAASLRSLRAVIRRGVKVGQRSDFVGEVGFCRSQRGNYRFPFCKLRCNLLFKPPYSSRYQL